jgi:hypothetical protein
MRWRVVSVGSRSHTARTVPSNAPRTTVRRARVVIGVADSPWCTRPRCSIDPVRYNTAIDVGVNESSSEASAARRLAVAGVLMHRSTRGCATLR